MLIIYEFLVFPILAGVGLFLYSLFTTRAIASFLEKIGHPVTKETEWHLIWFIFQMVVFVGILFQAYYLILTKQLL